MNANMTEMKSELTASMNANMGELNTKLTNVNEQISANKEELKTAGFRRLVNALELRFGEKCVKDYSRLQLKSRQQKVSETLQELATDVERLSHLAFSDCPTEVREVLAPQHFIDGVRDPEIQKAPNGGSQAVNESDTSNSSVERLERQMRSFLNRVESLMSQKADGKKTFKCWTCGRERASQRSCRARQGAEINSASQKEVSEN
ncbi:CCHC-type domain-containing protein [Trichonephila clavipes]|nr:CCHC-type domain-containing protein [Trichonephila clavipes]